VSPLILLLKPHMERGGYHTERFDAYLGDELICTSRSGWHDPARALLARGYPPQTLLHVQHAGRPFDPTIVPQSIGELAKWEFIESDRDGIRKRPWRSAEERFDAARRSTTASPASDAEAA
jgi:hypothetical protein